MPLYEYQWSTFCLDEDRIITQFHLDGVEAGEQFFM